MKLYLIITYIEYKEVRKSIIFCGIIKLTIWQMWVANITMYTTHNKLYVCKGIPK